MKVPGIDWVDIVQHQTSDGRPELRARVVLYGMARVDDVGDSVGQALDRLTYAAQRLARHVARAAGLRAAVLFGGDILPYLTVGLEVIDGRRRGHVDVLSKTPGWEYAEIWWGSSDRERVSPADFAARLRNEAWRLP